MSENVEDDLRRLVEWLSSMSEDLKKMKEWATYHDKPRWVKEVKELYEQHQRCLQHYMEVMARSCPFDAAVLTGGRKEPSSGFPWPR